MDSIWVDLNKMKFNKDKRTELGKCKAHRKGKLNVHLYKMQGNQLGDSIAEMDRTFIMGNKLTASAMQY